MKVLTGISKVIDKIVKIVGTAAAYLCILIMFLMLFEVFSRRIFHSPTIWSYETVSFLFGAMLMLTLPYGLQLGVNVRVDVLYNTFNEKVKNILDIVLFVVFFGIFMFVFTKAAFTYFGSSFAEQERSWSSWSPLLWPVKTTMPICGCLMLLQGVSELIKMVFKLIGKKDLLGIEDEVSDIEKEIAEIVGDEQAAELTAKAEEAAEESKKKNKKDKKKKDKAVKKEISEIADKTENKASEEAVDKTSEESTGGDKK